MDFLKKHAWWIVAGILLSHFALSTIVSSQESMTFDEKAHIPAAYSSVRYGDMRLNPEHPPLLKDLAGLPLIFLDLEFPLASEEWRNGVNEQWKVGDLFINCVKPDIACNDADRVLFWSRLPITLVAVILGVAIFAWTRKLGGTLAGLFAVTLYAFDPNIIAHSHYVTTDIGIAAFIFFAFFFFVRFLKRPSLGNTLLAGIFLGLAELAKFSAVLLFPIFGLFVILYALTVPQPTFDARTALIFRLRTFFAYFWKYLGSITVCFALIWILYFFNTVNMPGEKLVALADQNLSQQNLPAQLAHALVVNTSGSDIFKPLSEYFLGVAMVFARVASGNVHYYLGTVTDQASASYFPVVFLLKETLPFLFLLAFTTLYALYRSTRALSHETLGTLRGFLARSFQNKTAQYLAVFFILFYSYLSITGNLNIGLRHLFPMFPFLYMLVGKTIFDFFKRQQDHATRKSLSIILGGLVLSVIAIPVLSYPGYLSYFNAIGGGHENGYRYVTDSNYDWGQDMKRLRDLIERHNACLAGTASGCDPRFDGLPPIDRIRVDYFGGASPSYYLKDRHIGWWDKREPEAGWYAISSFFYQESLYKKREPGERSYEWLQSYTPIARAGDSIFVYYIPEEEQH